MVINVEQFDIAVVGVGSAGSIVAGQLASMTNLRVVAIEAGGSDSRPEIKVPIGYGVTFFSSKVNWCYESEKQFQLNDRSLYCPRGKVIGGSGSINAMVYVHGQPGDYHDWERNSNSEFGWQSVKSTFDVLEGKGKNISKNILSVSDVSEQHEPLLQRFFDASQNVGFDFTKKINKDNYNCVGHYPITTKNGIRRSAADVFLKPSLKSNEIKIIKNALVTKLKFTNKTVSEIEYIEGVSVKSIKVSVGVVMTAGAVNTPHILMLSGIGDKSSLKNIGVSPVADLRNIGKNLQDHLGIDYLFKIKEKSLNRELGSWRGCAKALLRYVAFRSGPFSLSVNQSGGFVNWKSRNRWPNIQLYFNPLTYSVNHKPRKRQLLRPDRFDGFAIGFQPCRPASRGEIKIQSADPLIPPLIDPNFLDSKQDLHDVMAGIECIEKILEDNNLKSIIVEPKTADLSKLSSIEKLADFRKRAVSIYHLCGSCRLGKDKINDPVDTDFRLRGFDNLWIADASVFPSIPSGNINSSVMMIAFKASQKIIQYVKKAKSA